MKPLVAIVGRPNVGKSMLFNKLVGQRLSIVEDTPGVTRDRLYAEAEWRNRKFDLVDTGGIEPGTDSEILSFMREQAEIAIQNATVIVFVCDIKTGLTASDQEVANMLLRSGKPVVLAVNKADQTGRENPDIYEFYNLGLGDPIAVSAVHGHGTGDLLDACFEHFPPEEEEEEDTDLIKVAVIGKPNVGKSSLINRILGEERVIVSDMAGTTRDAVDSYFENETGKFLFIDTAGMRKKAKVTDQIEKFSVLRAAMAIERSNVCLIMIDANEGVTEQDTKVAGMAHEAGKACIIVVNKWDAVEKDDKTMDKMRQDIRRDLAYMTYAPIVFISALTGQRVDRLFQLIKYVDDQAAMRITTGMLNSFLADATARVQPPTDKGRRLKIPVRLIMDEFPNIPVPGGDDFERILATMRSREISASIIIQNMAQLKALFKDNWESIVGLCDSLLYLGGNEQSTHKYLSELLGKETIETKSRGLTRGLHGNSNENTQSAGRELLTPDEVRLLDNRCALLFVRGELPVLDEKYPLEQHPNYCLTEAGGQPPYIHRPAGIHQPPANLAGSEETEEIHDENEMEETH